MDTNKNARHIVVICRGQFCELFHETSYFLNLLAPYGDYFDVIDSKNRPLLDEREIYANLKAILADADNTPPSDVAKSAVESSPRRIGSNGHNCAGLSSRTQQIGSVSLSWTVRFSLCA